MSLTFKTYSAVVKGAGLTDRQIRVVASDATVDRVGDIMVAEGCDLSDYRNNPIVLAQHNPDHPIGNADVTIKNGRVEALITFSPEGVSTKADEFCGLYKAGIMRAVSVGFDPIDSTPLAGMRGIKYTKWALLEISCVSVPANPSATVVERSAHRAAQRRAPANPWAASEPRRAAVDACEAAFLKSEWPHLAEREALAERHRGLAAMGAYERRRWYRRERSFRERFSHFERMPAATRSLVEVLFDGLDAEQRALFKTAFPMWREVEAPAASGPGLSLEERLAAVRQLELADFDRPFKWDPEKSAAENSYLERLYLSRVH